MLEVMPKEIGWFNKIPMLIGNQSSLEREFSGARVSNHDWGYNFGSHITNQNVKQSSTAQNNSKSYEVADCADEKVRFITGSSKLTAYSRNGGDGKCSKEEKAKKGGDTSVIRYSLRAGDIPFSQTRY